jgi:hypothetical protein
MTSRDKHKPSRFWTMRAKVMRTCELLFRSGKQLLINGLQVRVLPGSPLSRKDLVHFLTFPLFLYCGDFCGDSYLKSLSPVSRQGLLNG